MTGVWTGRRDGGLRLAGMCLLGTGAALLWPVLPSAGWRWGLLALGLAAGLWGVGVIRWMAWTVLSAALAWLHAGGVIDRQWPAALAGREWQVEGVIVDLPRHQTASSRFLMRLTAVQGQTDLAGRLLELHWRPPRHGELPAQRPVVLAGERWRLSVRVHRPRSLLNPGGFDAGRHALANRIHGIGWIQPDTAERLAPGQGLGHWRGRMSAGIDPGNAAGHGRFIKALAVGDTTALSNQDWDHLRSTGLTHLVAISGFHVTLMGVVMAIVAGGCWRLLPAAGRLLPRQQAQAAAALAGAVLYATASGLGLPAVRTVLMVAVVCLTRCRRRTASVWQSLAWALLAVLLVDPLSLLAAGFWLSYAGVAWLAWSLGNTPLGQWKGLVAAQAVATLGLLPMTVFLFGQASLIGPLTNLLAIPWWSLVVVPLCVVGLVLEAMVAGWGAWPWWLASHLFAASWRLFEHMAGWPLAEIWLPESGLAAVLLALAGVFWLLLPAGVPLRAAGGLLWLPLLWPRLDTPGQGQAEVHMLDVGQGQAMVVRTRRHVLLYDAGPAPPGGFDAGARIVVPALQALGAARADVLVVSHGDNDHAGGAQAVVRLLGHIEEIHAPAGMPGELPVTHRCERGMRWQWDGVTFTYLHPVPFLPYLGNESSCVLQVQGRGWRLLLTGDMGQVIERRLLEEAGSELASTVVQVPHHGSAGSSAGAFVRAASPQLALVSAGWGNRFGHPHPAVVTRWQAQGSEVLQTAESGALRVWLTAEGIAVRERRHHRARLWHGGR